MRNYNSSKQDARPSSRYTSASRSFFNASESNRCEFAVHNAENFAKSKDKFENIVYILEMENAIIPNGWFFKLLFQLKKKLIQTYRQGLKLFSYWIAVQLFLNFLSQFILWLLSCSRSAIKLNKIHQKG